MAFVAQDLLSPVKQWLRIVTDALDDELIQTIKACELDLINGGVAKVESSDPVVQQAVKLYCKAMFGYESESEKFAAAYEHLKAALALSGIYNKEADNGQGGGN